MICCTGIEVAAVEHFLRRSSSTLLKKLEFSLDMSRQTSNMRSPRNGERVNICLKNRSHATCQEESTLHEQHFWHQDLLLSRPPSRPSAYLLKLHVPISSFESNPSHPFTETGNAEALRFRSIHISALLRLTKKWTLAAIAKCDGTFACGF